MSRSVSLAAAAVICLALAATAQAQIPNPLRRAKEKAGQALTGQRPAQGGVIKFDDVMLELSPPVLDRVVLGLRARANHKGSGGRSAAALRRRSQELHEESEALLRDRGDERSEFTNTLGEAQSCRNEVLSGLENQHSQDMQRRFMSMTGANLQGDRSANARFMQEFQRIGMEMSAAGAAGDTARSSKAQAEYNKLMGIDPKADTAKANAQCRLPTPPPWLARADAASEESNQLYGEARDVEVAGNAAGTQASGMTAEQFAMALERIIAYLEANATMKFSATEQQALSARRGFLQPLVS